MIISDISNNNIIDDNKKDNRKQFSLKESQFEIVQLIWEKREHRALALFASKFE